MRLLNWEHALGYMTREPEWKRTIALGGLLMLVAPPVGWALALGYRSTVGERLMNGRTPAMQRWGSNLADMSLRGAKSSGVILGYLSPALLLFLGSGAGSLRAATMHYRELAAAVVAMVVLPPAGIPALPLLAYTRWPWFTFAPAVMAIVAALFMTAILLLPSAFLRVAATGRYSAAFQVAEAARFAIRNAAAYAEAWVLSLLVSAVGVLVVPLMPWLLFWSYLAILHAFLQVLWRSEQASMRRNRAA
jgi:hypothetical protein